MAKGRTLEKLYGSGYFAFMLLVFTALTNVVYLALNYSLAILLWDSSFYYSCAVGFSGKSPESKRISLEVSIRI